jgi:hypothetical protein
VAESQMLQEAIATLGDASAQQARPGRLRIRLIEGDVQGSSGFYPAATLKRDASVFKAGTKCYVNHPSLSESVDLPERSVYDLAGTLTTDARYEGDGLYAEVELAPHHRWIEGVKDMIGMSIRASGTVEDSTVATIRGPVVTSITAAESVDFVTTAGAGGKIVSLLESARTAAIAEAAKPGKQELREARNIGAHMEAHIHKSFTNRADDMYGDGRLTREERIGLSEAIGKGLDAFTAHVQEAHPQLYARDLWTDPAAAKVAEARRLREAGPLTAGELSTALADAVREVYGGEGIYTWVRDNTDTWVVFTVEDPTDCDLYQQTYTVDAKTNEVTLTGQPTEVIAHTTYEPAPADPDEPPDGEQITESKPGTKPTDTKEGIVPEMTEEQVRQLAEAATVKAALDAANAKLAEAAKAEEVRTAALAESQASKAEADLKLARFEAVEAARPIAATLLTESALPSAAQARVLGEAVTSAKVPLRDGVLDEPVFRASIAEAIKAEETYLASLQEGAGAGQPRGLGESKAPEGDVPDAKATEAGLVEAFKLRGMSPEAAQLAASGRRF